MISPPCLFDLINAIYNGMTVIIVTAHPTLQHIHFLKALHFFFRKKICNKELQNVLFKQIVNVFKKKINYVTLYIPRTCTAGIQLIL